jgi:AraC family transcriptional regulator
VGIFLPSKGISLGGGASLSSSSLAIVRKSGACTTGESSLRNGRSFSWDAVAISELRICDGDLPQQTAARTSLLLQMSEPVVLELGFNGNYRSRLIGANHFCLTPAGAPVPARRWRGERQILVAELSPALVRSVAEAHNLQSFEFHSRYGISDPQITHLLLTLRADLQEKSPAEDAYVDMIVRAIVMRLFRAHANSTPVRVHRGGLSQPLLRRVIEYLDEHLDQNLGLRHLAGVSGLSEDHFARAFRESTGVPPHRFLLQRRMARARQLLEISDLPIAEIALALGFADQSHLTRLFRRETGMTPGQMRAQLKLKLQEYRDHSSDSGILQEVK